MEALIAQRLGVGFGAAGACAAVIAAASSGCAGSAADTLRAFT
jgi:hypothetical protein